MLRSGASRSALRSINTPAFKAVQTPFRQQFGMLNEAEIFTAITSYCGAQSGGSLGNGEVVLRDQNGQAHVFAFETFFNRHEALTLGYWLRPCANLVKSGYKSA